MQRNNEEKINKKKKLTIKKIGKKIFYFFLIMIFSIALFCFSIANSTTFRQFIIGKTTTFVSNFLVADIQIKDIRFDRIYGIAIEELKIITANDTLASIEKTIIDLNFEKIIFENKIVVNSIELQNPKIKLLRSEIDSIWNFAKIAKPSTSTSPPDTTPNATVINVNSVKIKNGSFVYWDSVATWQPYSKINFVKMAWENLELDLQNTVIDIGNSSYSTFIASVAAKEIHSEMDIKKLRTNAKISKDGIEAKKTLIKFDDCKITFDAEMRNFNVFGTSAESKIEKAVMSIDMKLENFNPKFIDNFAIIPVEIGFVKKMSVQAKGTLEEMIIPKITVDMERSHIELENARTTNLLNPEKLTYEGTVNSTFIQRSDFPKILKNIDLTAVPNFLHSHITNTKIVGNLDSVSANLNLKTGIGNVNGSAAICFSAVPMRYSVDLQTTNLNIANLINQPQIKTNLNSTVKIIGKDFEPEKLNATVAIELNNSQINEFFIPNSKILLDYCENNILKFEEFLITFNDSFSGFGDDFLDNKSLKKSKIIISGEVDLKDFQSPNIDVIVDAKNINLSSLLDDKLFPAAISSIVKINSKGLDFNKMQANVVVDFSEINFVDKSMFPFKIDAEIFTDIAGSKPNFINILANNDFGKIMDLRLKGDFSMEVFTEGIAKKSEQIINNLSDRIEGIVSNFVRNQKIQQRKIEHLTSFPKSNFDVFLDARTLNFLDFFVDSLTVNSASIFTKIKFKSDSNFSQIKIDTMNINSFDLKYKDSEIMIDKLHLATDISVGIFDSIPKISSMGINLSVLNMLRFSGINIDSLRFSVNYENDEYCFNLQAIYDSLIFTKLDGGFKIDKNDLNIFFDSLIVIYENEKWFNSKQVQIDYDNHGLTVNDFVLSRKNKEQIVLTGGLQEESLNNLNILITNFEFNDLNKLVFSPLKMEHLPVNSRMDTLNILLTGTFDNPKITSLISLRNLRYERQFIGHFRGSFSYEDEKISGRARIFDNSDQNRFLMNVRSLPIYLGFDTTKNQFPEDKPLDITVRMDNLSTKVLTPFVPEIDNLSGTVNGRITVGGFLPDKYDYSGNISLENVGFRLIPTNMEYTTFGNIDIKKDKIEFDKLRIRNKASDLRNGEALVSGKIKLEKFDLKNIDISLTARQFQILSEKTALSMPFFYGKMVIATEERPLRFHGTLTEPNLDGTVTIVSADMKMPQVLNEEVIKREQKFTYINKDVLRVTVTSTIDSAKLDSINNAKLEEEKRHNQNGTPQGSIVDLLNIDLSVRIRQFSIALDLGAMIGQIFARIGTTDPRTPLQYVKNRNQPEANIFGGDLEILAGSTVQIGRTMSARGTITFPSARLSRPVLNLLAEAKIKDQNTNYIVELKITGTPAEPKLAFSYSIDGVPVTGDNEKITRDALMILVTGSLGSSNILGEGANMAFSQFASRNLTDLLLGTLGAGVVQSANLKFEGDGFDVADISISGTIYGVATWTIGGKIQDISSNYSISIDIPININNDILNNILLQISHATDIYNSNFDRNAKNWEVKLKFGGHW